MVGSHWGGPTPGYRGFARELGQANILGKSKESCSRPATLSSQYGVAKDFGQAMDREL
jgi:hypothetical protein